MDAIGGRSQVLADIGESLCRDADVDFAVAFGSQVTGDSHPSSDLDLAVKFADGLSSRERFRKRCFLSGDLQREDAPFVDVSDIEALPVDVARDAVTGKLLCGDEQAFRQFKAEIGTKFAERRDDLRHHQRSVIDRIAEDGLHG
ncbi:type VII toxin-antitoxin system MntA family adenylyltransferase antitoxin [Halorussus sp. AFM4]|uniref:type VII toxin-antitoxin system MntA family adenylyltransferase antitoxin n=1 Tax=Halorussus sp. AFM4 TaxID=3421651 RepID=UPI003EC08625